MQFTSVYDISFLIGYVIISLIAVRFIITSYFNYKRNQKRNFFPKDTVILHQIPTKGNVPSM
jgi:hypothetical protein